MQRYICGKKGEEDIQHEERDALLVHVVEYIPCTLP